MLGALSGGNLLHKEDVNGSESSRMVLSSFSSGAALGSLA
jgi:hypothetical protein